MRHGIVFVKDCGSTHGTWLNGSRLSEEDGLQPLPRDGRVVLGHVRPIQLRISETEPLGAPQCDSSSEAKEVGRVRTPVYASATDSAFNRRGIKHMKSDHNEALNHSIYSAQGANADHGSTSGLALGSTLSMFEMLGGDQAAEDCIRMIMAMSTFETLRALMCVDRQLNRLSSESIRSSEWSRRPENRAAIRLAMWTGGLYKVRTVGSSLRVSCLSMHGDFLAHGGEDGVAMVWSLDALANRTASAGHPLHMMRRQCKLTSIAVYSAPHLRLATGGLDGVTKVWLGDGVMPSHEIAHVGAITALAWVSECALMTGSFNGIARLWGAPWDHICVQSRVDEHLAPIRAVASADVGNVAVTCSDDRTVKVWSLDPFRATTTLRGHGSGVCAVATHGTCIASGGSSDPHIRLWDMRQPRCVSTIQDDGHGVPAIALGSAYELVTSSITSSLVSIFDLRKARVVARLPGHTTPVLDLATDTRHIASRDSHGSLQLRQLNKASSFLQH